MIRRSIREWDYLPIEEPGPGAFSRIEADKIVECAAGLQLSGFEGERIVVNHPRKLRAQQVVGIIATDSSSLEILPKIDGADSDAAARRALVHMLAEVIDLEIAHGRMTDLDYQRHDLLEILIKLFCERLFEVVHRGLPRRYIQHEEDLGTLRGRLDAKRQFTVLAATPQRLACRFDELSPDIALNQIMKAAVKKLLRLSRVPENQRRLTELAFAFSEISDVPVAALRWHDVVIDRTNQAWAQLLALARLLLGNRFQTTSWGSAKGFSLLFEMNTLFEEFVGRSFRKALAGTGLQVQLQGPRDHALQEVKDGQLRFATRPDITVTRDGAPILIVDTKWKRLRGAIDDAKFGVSPSDVYQMMAYAHVYRCDRLILLYPYHDELDAEPGVLCSHRVRGAADTRISIATISLFEPRTAALQLRHLQEFAQQDHMALETVVA